MKLITIVILCFTFSTCLFGQEKVDPRIQEYLGEEITRKIVTEHPDQLEYYNNLLFNSYDLIPVKSLKDKNISIENISNIPLKNEDSLSYDQLIKTIKEGTFNIFAINLKRFKEQNRYFRIGEGDQIFILKAENRI